MILLYRSFGTLHNAREGQNLHLGRPGPFQRPGAGIRRDPSGEHIVHHEDIAAPDRCRSACLSAKMGPRLDSS